MEIPTGYKGREQAFIKHTLLKTYLERLFMIVGKNQRTISYVDCFAGPWQEESDDLKNTSIAISLDIMRKCHSGLKQFGKEINFRALYIEKDERAFDRLTAFLKERSEPGIETCAFKGEFIDLQNDILQWCGVKDFTFFFIDPKGWKQAIEIPTLLPLLQRPYSEYLINFMYDFLLRTHTQEPRAEDMKAIFGEVPNTQGMPSKEREAFLLKKYRAQLINAQPTGDKPRSVYVSVLDPVKDRTKYHLVYLTRHPLGIKVFMEESEKIELVQKTVRARAKHDYQFEKTGQYDIFAQQENIQDSDDHAELSEVKQYWLSQLSATPKRFGVMELADMLEDKGWFISDFQEAFQELENEGRVKNLDATRKRPVNAVNFEKNESLVRIIS